MSRIIDLTYAEIKALRAGLNARLYYEAGGVDGFKFYDLLMQDGTMELACRIAQGGETAASYADFEANVKPFCNKMVDADEVRFAEIMDWSKKYTWDGRTHGFPEHRPAGAVTYDDVKYRWLDGQGDVLSYLYLPDGADAPGYWKLGDGTDPGNDTDYIKYYPQDGVTPTDPEGEWKLVADSTVVTSSKVCIVPYDGYKIVVNQVKVKADDTATLASALHFRFKSVMDPATAQAYGLEEPGAGYYDGYYVVGGTPMFLWGWIAETMGLPEPQGGWYTGVYTVKDFVYHTVEEFQRLANYQDNDGSWVFDYAKTTPIVVDSRFLQRIEVELGGTSRALNTDLAKATYIAMKVRSF